MRRIPTRLIVTLAAVALGGATSLGSQTRRPPPASQAAGDQRQSVIVDAAARVAPAVVSVNVLKRERQMPDDPFAMFFMPRGYERKVEGYGSGFIISADGVVITNQHVTGGAEQIVVTTREGTDYPAKLLGEDPLTDIAVLKVDGSGFPTAPLGASSDLIVGEWVVAIGNPFAYLLGNSEPSVTAGVVSAVGRNLLPSGDQAQAGVYVDMIQTDAPINPGNSGGPLVDVQGHVVGVNSSILSPSGGSVGIGFAIPIERAVRVANELRRYGHVRRSWVGLDVAGTEDLREWKRSGGLRVASVAPGGPAARAGVAAGDVLLNVRGRALHTFLDWEAVMLDTGPGDTLVVAYRRADRKLSARLGVSDLPSTVAEKVSILGGLQAVTVTPAIRQERSIQSEQGALIYQISDDAQQATGLRTGDVVFQINRQAVRSAEDLQRLFKTAAGRDPVTVWFERAGSVGRSTFYVE